MYRLILVDDEPWALTGLEEIIPWEELGFEIAGRSASAEDALRLFDRCDADAVFTDIRMPKMSGIELIARIKEIKPETECVIVSAYSDFETARKALEYRAAAYVTKPLEAEEVKETALRVKARLDARGADPILVKTDDPLSLADTASRLEKIIRHRWRAVVLSGGPPRIQARQLIKLHLRGASLHAALIAADEKNYPVMEAEKGTYAFSLWHEDSGELAAMLREASAAGCGGFSYSDHPVVSAIQYYIAQHYRESLSLEDLASRFNISGSYLGELFKKHSADTVINFVKSVRLENACRLLEYSSQSLKEIVDETGFNDAGYFNRSFRQRFGQSPIRFRSSRANDHFRPDFHLR
jgi:two-component system response regulator YesN